MANMCGTNTTTQGACRACTMKEVLLSAVNVAGWISKLQECSYGQIWLGIMPTGLHSHRKHVRNKYNPTRRMRCESKWVIWVGQITQTQHLSKDYKKSKWWCASAVPEGKSLMGKGMLLHQRGDADADRGHSWHPGVIDDEGNLRLEPS